MTTAGLCGLGHRPPPGVRDLANHHAAPGRSLEGRRTSPTFPMRLGAKEGRMRTGDTWWAPLVGLLAVACAPSLTVRADFDRAASFDRYRTFRLDEGRVLDRGNTPPNTIVKDRIESALRSQLAAEGLVPAGHLPDLVVKYVAGARTVQELQTVGNAGNYWGGPGMGDVWVEQVPEGTLVIDLIDAHTGRLVWRAHCHAEGEGLSRPETIQKAVAKAFEKYPPRA